MFASNVQFGYPCPRDGGASCPGWYILPPHPGFGSGSVISQFLLHHNHGIFSYMRYKHYFGQTEIFTSNVQFDYLCSSGEGQAVWAGLSPPPPGFGSGSVISQFLLHHNLGISSCKRCEHYFSQTDMFTSIIIPPQTMFVCVWGGGGCTVFTLSIHLSVHVSVHPSVTFWFFFNILKRQWWKFIKFCRHIDIDKMYIYNRKLRARGQFCWSYCSL